MTRAVTSEGIKNAIEARADSIEHGYNIDIADIKVMAREVDLLIACGSDASSTETHGKNAS